VSANLYSLIETAKANNVESYTHFKKALTLLPQVKTIDDVDVLLSWCVKGVVV
jgi:hypothetical protein